MRAGYALTLFAFNNRFQQYLILETGMITLSIFEPFLQSKVETERAMAAFQVHGSTLAFHIGKYVTAVNTSPLGIWKNVY